VGNGIRTRSVLRLCALFEGDEALGGSIVDFCGSVPGALFLYWVWATTSAHRWQAEKPEIPTKSAVYTERRRSVRGIEEQQPAGRAVLAG
jgi:hypothetical protein